MLKITLKAAQTTIATLFGGTLPSLKSTMALETILLTFNQTTAGTRNRTKVVNDRKRRRQRPRWSTVSFEELKRRTNDMTIIAKQKTIPTTSSASMVFGSQSVDAWSKVLSVVESRVDERGGERETGRFWQSAR